MDNFFNKFGNLTSTQANPKGKWDELAQKRPILEGCRNFSKEELKRRIRITIMDLISSANDMCMLYGFSDYHGKIKQDNVQSRQDSASIVLTPRVSETASLCRAGHLSARTATVASDLFSTSARAAEVYLQLFPNKETTGAVVERANVTRDRELLRLCNISDYTQTLNIGQHLQTRAARNSSGIFCTPFGKVDRPARSTGGLTSKNNTQATWRNVYLGHRRMLKHWRESAKHAKPWHVGLGWCAHGPSSELSTDCGNWHRHSERKAKQWDIRKLRATCGERRHMKSWGRYWARQFTPETSSFSHGNDERNSNFLQRDREEVMRKFYNMLK